MSKIKILKDGRFRIKFPGKSHGILLNLIQWCQEDQQDGLRLQLLKEIEAKLVQSPTVRLRMSEIELITECLNELPEEYAVILSADLNPYYQPIEIHNQ